MNFLALLLLFFAISLASLLSRRRSFFAAPPAASETVPTTAGPVRLPIRYFDGSLVGAFWLVEPQAAARLLPDTLEPLVLPGGLGAIAGLFLFEHRNTSIGAYSELILTIQAVRKGSGAGVLGYAWDMLANVLHFHEMLSLLEQESSGLYVVTLPVTTKAAKAAGREIWGFNKYLAKITSDFTDPHRASFQLESELRVTLEQGALTLLTPGLPFLTYCDGPRHGPNDNNNGPASLGIPLVRTKVLVGHTARWGGTANLQVTGQGPTADALESLGIARGVAPHAVFRTDTLQANLPRGKELF